MVRKSARKNKGKKSAVSSGASLNDRGRYQPMHKKATGPSSAKAAKKSKKQGDSQRKAKPAAVAPKAAALPPSISGPGNRRQSLRLAQLASAPKTKSSTASGSAAAAAKKKGGKKGAASGASLLVSLKGMFSSLYERFASSFA